jgi:hypothetical protein
MVSIEGRLMTKNTCLEGLDSIFRKLFTCGIKEGINAV